MISLQDYSPGDVVGFSGSDYASDLINIGTFGLPRYGLSHIGIIAGVHGVDPSIEPKPNLLFESTTFNTRPCVILERLVRGAQAQHADRINDYPGKVWVYRLRRSLSQGQQVELYDFLTKMLGTPYDLIGAVHSGGKIWAAIQKWIHGESMSSLFCSEWVAAALRDIDHFDTDDVSKWSPNSLIREMQSRAMLLRPERVR